MTIGSRLLKAALPICGAAAGTYLLTTEPAPPVRTALAFAKSPATGYQSFDDLFPRGTWDDNWDFRKPASLVNKKKYEKASDEEREAMLKEKTAKAQRTIILIRHGQYQLETKDKFLTELGREQAICLGKRLATSGIQFDRLIMSTMARATETANLILEQMPKDLEKRSCSLLEEGPPYPTVPEVSHWKPDKNEFFAEGARIESAFRKYIHRAEPSQEKDSVEIIVCHANVIRYFICRALQFPPEGWLRFSLGNCSITTVVIRPNGNVSIRSIGDVGHHPAEKITFT